jgi:group I intron endonuclease
MIFLYENSSKIPSIYEIKNLHSQRSYIGQTVKPKSRWAGHKNSLIRGRHGNRFLLADYNKCKKELGHDDFLEFRILEILPNSTQQDRNKRELYWLHFYATNGFNLYNMDLECGGNYSKSEETRFKISQSNLGKILSDEHKAKIIENAKNNPNYGLKGKKHSDQTKKKISEGRIGIKHWHYGKKMPRQWIDKRKAIYEVRLISPIGKIYEKIIGLTDFAKTHGLSVAGLRFLLSGERKTHKGWKRVDDPMLEVALDSNTKQCSQCKEEKSLSLFNKKTGTKDGKRAHCKACQRKYKK